LIVRCLVRDGKSIAYKVKHLPVPESLKRYLLMNEKLTLADAGLVQQSQSMALIDQHSSDVDVVAAMLSMDTAAAGANFDRFVL
jgi:hypothetical protein